VLGQFSFDRATLGRQHLAQIDEIAARIVASQGAPGQINSACIVGHTDTVGSEDYNYRLAQRRAVAVRQELIKAIDRRQSGLSTRLNLEAQSAGESTPIRDGQGQEDRVRSRRVEVFLVRDSMPSSLDRQVEEVLRFIQDEARRAARRPKTIDPASKFARVLGSRYLGSYLAAPSAALAAAALEAIGRQNTSGVVTRVCGRPDFWEAATPGFNGTPIPAILRRLPGFSALPPNFGSATEILTVRNRRSLSHIDIPFLLGKRTLDLLDCSTRAARGRDPDLQANNSINESQLMHWATGVRFVRLGRDRLRELFIAYELWHLELWDVFGHDPINDLIAEEAGRHMADQIRALRMNRRNYIATLDQGFIQARAWVGALLRIRRHELDRQIKADPPPPAFIHWSSEVSPTSPDHPYRAPSIRRMLVNGVPIARVKASMLVKRYIEVYTLLFEADAWEQANGQIPITPLQRKIVNGGLNRIFRAISAAERGGRSRLIADMRA
jgi:hypothetical protein